MRKKYASCTHRNFFPVYGKSWGQTLMTEAQQRGLTRTDLIRQAVGDYLQRNPIVQPLPHGDRTQPRERNQPGQIQDR